MVFDYSEKMLNTYEISKKFEISNPIIQSILKKKIGKLRNLSESAANGITRGIHGNSWSKPRFVEELGHIIRSTLEERFCLKLKKKNIEYQFEPGWFKVNINGENKHYVPDIYLKKEQLYIELKGWEKEDYNVKSEAFKEQYPQNKIIVIF